MMKYLSWGYGNVEPFSPIIGKTLVSVDHSDDTLTFNFSDNTMFVIRVNGDCCSRSWWDDVEIDTKFPSVLTSVDTASGGEVEPREYEYVAKVDFLTVMTTNGRIFATARNDSNGYYGSEFSWELVEKE